MHKPDHSSLQRDSLPRLKTPKNTPLKYLPSAMTGPNGPVVAVITHRVKEKVIRKPRYLSTLPFDTHTLPFHIPHTYDVRAVGVDASASSGPLVPTVSISTSPPPTLTSVGATLLLFSSLSAPLPLLPLPSFSFPSHFLQHPLFHSRFPSSLGCSQSH
jgi:hypothetical protein